MRGATPPPRARSSPRATCSARSTSRAPARAGRARRPAGRRDPQDPPRRHQLPRRRHGIGELAGLRARHRASSTRSRRATATGRTSSTSTRSPRCCGRTARCDLVVADGSPLEIGTLGASGAVPGWPGADVYPPQPMVTQIRRCSSATPRRGVRAVSSRVSARADSRRPAVAAHGRRTSTPPRAGSRFFFFRSSGSSLRRSGERPAEIGPADRWRGVHASGKIRPDPGAALLELYDAALPQVYGYLLARCGRRALAEDLTAETFLAAVAACRREPPPSQHRLAGRHRPAQARRPLAGRRAGDPRAAAVDRGGRRRPLGRAPRRAAGARGAGRAVGPAPGRADLALPRRPSGRRGRARARPHPAAPPRRCSAAPAPRSAGATRRWTRRTLAMPDPLRALRAPAEPVDPDPAFAAPCALGWSAPCCAGGHR